jgi:prolyl-tRNA synthetase
VRWSTMHIPTLRDDPAEAGAPSHRLLLRAGYVRQLMAGHYSLPLAVRVRLKVIGIIRDEMSRIGAQEILMPVMHRADVWRRSGRWDVMGDEMFRLKDRKGADIALGMTHEEIVTTLGTELSSYRELPQMWYQFQSKMRDEPGPKAGLMRTREFAMKDSCSFDLDAQGLDRSYEARHRACARALERMGIPAITAEASNGSHGRLRLARVRLPVRRGRGRHRPLPRLRLRGQHRGATSVLAAVYPAVDAAVALAAPERFDTPGVRTIEDLATGYDAAAERQVKTLVYVLDGDLARVLLRGDHALEEQKLIDATGARAVRPAEAEEIVAAPGAHPGSLGSVAVDRRPIVADLALRGWPGMVTGANTDNVHLRGSTRPATSASAAGLTCVPSPPENRAGAAASRPPSSRASRSVTSSSSATSTPTPWT